MANWHIYLTVAAAVLTLVTSVLGGAFYLGAKFSRIHDDIAGLKTGLTEIRLELKSMNILQNRLSVVEEKIRNLENHR
jgi:hypothetical protein